MRREDLTARIMKDMDPDLFDFLTTYMDSFIKWDLLRFFEANPYTMDSEENIARYTGRTVADVQIGLQELVQQGVLDKIMVNNMAVYKLGNDPTIQARLAQFIEAMRDHGFRRKVIYHIVRH